MNDITKYVSEVQKQFSTFLPKGWSTWSDFTDRNSIVDMQSGEGWIRYYIDVPGVKEENIQITQEGAMVNVRAERTGRNSKSNTEATFTVDSRELNLDSLNAVIADGVLTIEFTTRKQEVKPESRKITVKSMK
jgi:HSP20 family molecular chaperone IbpA